jgi:spermidine/putrescine-binding protein
MQTLQTLSQKLASKSPGLVDFACNAYADKIAMINLFIKLNADNPELVKKLQELRDALKEVGEALWIKNSDVLTNLGLKVGRTGRSEINGSSDSET